MKPKLSMIKARPAHQGEHGAVLVLVMITLAALLAGGAVALYLQLSASKAAGFVGHSRQSLFCAEAGLSAARPVIIGNYAVWGTMLDVDPANDPPGYPVLGDIDGDGINDFVVTIVDDDDELPPLPDNPDVDNNLTVFIESRCTKYNDAPRVITELVDYQGAGDCTNRNQAGNGCQGTGNKN